MLDRKYGKCLSNLWQKSFENGNIFGNMNVSLQNGNFLAVLISFYIFSIFLNFLSFTIRTRSISLDSQYPAGPERLGQTYNTALSNSGQYSSQPVVFPAYKALKPKRTSVADVLSSSPKYSSCVPDGVMGTGFERSLKYYQRLSIIFALLLRKTPFWLWWI